MEKKNIKLIVVAGMGNSVLAKSIVNRLSKTHNVDIIEVCEQTHKINGVQQLNDFAKTLTETMTSNNIDYNRTFDDQPKKSYKDKYIKHYHQKSRW